MSRTGLVAILRLKLFRGFIGQLFADADAFTDTEHTVDRVTDLNIEQPCEIADGKLVLGIQHIQQPLKILYGFFAPVLQL